MHSGKRGAEDTNLLVCDGLQLGEYFYKSRKNVVIAFTNKQFTDTTKQRNIAEGINTIVKTSDLAPAMLLSLKQNTCNWNNLKTRLLKYVKYKCG